ncbi:DUF6686 family protein [uncultured Sunxiuqinia sp.]|uniref:DUF6686 family protein n=1 Tax=uncultured Sunxiuqinia sp. TaxID=1573825 RepID=UPI002AA7C6DF|nr:DUF6686 family protein [uncultured Sunxiuqinia sp.]
MIEYMKKVSKNGQLFVCNTCNKIHLEFGNIGMDFKSPTKLEELRGYLNTVNSNHFENEILANNYRRKILIPFANTNIKLLLSDQEIIELIELINSFLAQDSASNKTFNRFDNLRSISSIKSIILN